MTNKHIIKHHRALEFINAPSFYDELSHIATPAASALRFTMLTVARTSEVTRATPQEFDFKKMLWRIPATRMKARKPHIVPISDHAMTLIDTRLRSNNVTYLFY